jgi:hypothetical protein
MQLNPTAFLLATFLSTLLVTGAVAQSKKKSSKKAVRTQTTSHASSDLAIQYNVDDLVEAKAWFDILLEGNPGTIDSGGTTVTYKMGSTTLVLIKQQTHTTPLDEEPAIFFKVDINRVDEVFRKLTDPKYQVKILWDLHKVDGDIQVGALQYRRARVGVISNPPFLTR